MNASAEWMTSVGLLDQTLEALQLPTALSVLDLGMTIRWINQAACEQYQLSAPAIIGRNWYEWFPESRSRMALHRELARGERAELNLPRVPLCKTRAGTRYVSFRLRPFKIADGSIGAIIGIGEDVTEIVQAERRVLESEERFRMVSTCAVDLLAIVDANATIKFLNAHGQRALGIPDGEATCLFQHVHAEDSARTMGWFKTIVASPVGAISTTTEFRSQDADGMWRWLECTGTNMLNISAVRGVVVTGREISERKLFERRLLETINQEQDRIGRDLHDGIGQELTGIALMIRSVASNLKREDEERLPRAVRELETVLDQTNSTIESIRMLACGLQPVRDDRGGLAHGLRGLAERISASCGIPIDYSCQLTSPLTIDELIADHLFRIAQEAINNAVRHAQATRIHVRLKVQGNTVQLTVSDDGCGLRSRRDSLRGSGMRNMSYRTHAIGGEFIVDDNRGGGTRITVRLEQT